MYGKNKKMLAVSAFALFGAASGVFAADAITVDIDGPGGLAPINNVTAFDWAPGNTLAVGGNQAVLNFINGGVYTVISNGPDGVAGTNFFDPAGADDTAIVINNNPQASFSVFYQSTLNGLVIGDPGSPLTPVGLNSTFEITATARFDERVFSVSRNLVEPGKNIIGFQHVPNANEYIEIFFDSLTDGVGVNSNDLSGLGHNDSVRILAANIDDTTFSSNFSPFNTILPENLDQFSTDNYPGQLTISGSGATLFAGTVDAFDPNFFIDVLSVVGFSQTTNGNQKLPFEEVDPSGAFLVGTAGTSVGGVPVAAGAGAPGDPVLGIGTINGFLPIGVNGGGPSVQFQADVNTSFTRVSVVVPEPATGIMALMGLVGLVGGRRARKA